MRERESIDTSEPIGKARIRVALFQVPSHQATKPPTSVMQVALEEELAVFPTDLNMRLVQTSTLNDESEDKPGRSWKCPQWSHAEKTGQ